MFCQEWGWLVCLLCLTNGAHVEGCMSRSASEGMAGQVATCGVSGIHWSCMQMLESWFETYLAFSRCVALVKSQAL